MAIVYSATNGKDSREMQAAYICFIAPQPAGTESLPAAYPFRSHYWNSIIKRGYSHLNLTMKIDLHAHVVPPCWKEDCIKSGHGEPDGMPGIPVRSIETILHFFIP
jgi:hypothetical protein